MEYSRRKYILTKNLPTAALRPYVMAQAHVQLV
jgi:hypothetical protein